MNSKPLHVALTGSIATGKSYCLARFADLGAPTIDADALARQAVAPGTAGFDTVVARFGGGVLRRDGSLDREALARLVFKDEEARRALEAIVHPVVYAAITRWFESLDKAGDSVAAAIADIPLLYETGRERDFDCVIATTCRPEQQLERLMERSGLTEPEAQSRLDSQMPAADKARKAAYVIDTSGTFPETNLQVLDVWEKLKTRAAQPR